jgi:hypothetical protein
MTPEPVEIARRFAQALDAEDYAAASALLAEDCVYYIGGARLAGRQAIVDSYATNGQSAKERFDAVEYASEVSVTAPDTAVVLFKDFLRIGDQRHEFNCRQHLRMNSDGLIEEIRHEELPHQRERLEEFEARHRA